MRSFESPSAVTASKFRWMAGTWCDNARGAAAGSRVARQDALAFGPWSLRHQSRPQSKQISLPYARFHNTIHVHGNTTVPPSLLGLRLCVLLSSRLQRQNRVFFSVIMLKWAFKGNASGARDASGPGACRHHLHPP